MPVRISTVGLNQAISDAISASSQRMLKLQQGLGDGKAVRTPSDDPVRAQQAMWYRERIRASEQYSRNVETVSSTLSNTDSTLTQIQDAVAQLNSLVTSAGDDSLGADGRAALATEVDQLSEQLAELGNSRYAGTYLFGGTRSLTPPLQVQRDAQGNIQSITLTDQGSSGAVKRQVDQDLSLTINVKPADLFGKDGGLFTQLKSLREALQANDGGRIRAMSSEFTQASDRVSTASTAIGALIQRTDALKSRLAEQTTNYQSGLSQAEDLDMAQAAVDLQSEQLSLQAALEAGSRILNLSLLDYLK
jgi:flagellar hook-associated protein 3 FlgL